MTFKKNQALEEGLFKDLPSNTRQLKIGYE